MKLAIALLSALPAIICAQTYDGASGVTAAATADPVGGVLDVTSIDYGYSIRFEAINLDGISAICIRASCSSSGGTVRVRQGSLAGKWLFLPTGRYPDQPGIELIRKWRALPFMN